MGTGVSVRGLLQRMAFESWHFELLLAVHHSRYESLDRNVDSLITNMSDEFNFVAKTGAIRRVAIPSFVHCTMPAKLGFTGAGTVKYSGSIRCTAAGDERRISLGVGVSPIRVYD